MTDNEKLMKQAEGYGALRRGLLVVNALSYIGWVGAMGAHYMGALSPSPHTLLLAQFICFPVWFLSLLGIFWTMWGLKQQTRALIDDEGGARLSRRSFQIGYWVLLLAVTGVNVTAYFTVLDIRAVLPFIIGLGVAAPGMTYAFLYRS